MQNSYTKELLLMALAVALGTLAVMFYDHTRQPDLPPASASAAAAQAPKVAPTPAKTVPTAAPPDGAGARERELEHQLADARRQLAAAHEAASAAADVVRPAEGDAGARVAECQAAGKRLTAVPSNPAWPTEGMRAWRLCATLLQQKLPDELQAVVVDTAQAMLGNGLQFVRQHESGAGREAALLVARELRTNRTILSPLQAAALEKAVSPSKPASAPKAKAA